MCTCVVVSALKNETRSAERNRNEPPSTVYSTSRSVTYRMAVKSHNPKYSHVFTEMFRFKPASQFLELYRSVRSCALYIEDLYEI
jgi:hypothetical protein